MLTWNIKTYGARWPVNYYCLLGYDVKEIYQRLQAKKCTRFITLREVKRYYRLFHEKEKSNVQGSK